MTGLDQGWAGAMGLRILRASPGEVACEWEVTELHRQVRGIVHGGVHCGVIATLASIGAGLHPRWRDARPVAVECSTSFVRAVREGTLRALARPVADDDAASLVWDGWVRDGDGRLVAQGRVRLLPVEDTAA